MTPRLPRRAPRWPRCPRSGIRAIMELAMERGDTLNLSFGEPDFDTPAHIVEAAGAAARAGRTRYTASRGITELREAAAASITRRAGHDVAPDQIVATVGGVQGVFSTLAALADRGDAVLVPDPSWPNYVGICTLLGLEVVRYPLPAANGFEPDLDALEQLAKRPGVKVLITNTPSNPTGAVWQRDTVEATVGIAVRNGLYVLSDEVYDEMAFDGVHAPSAPFAPDHVVTVYSLSKTYAMTGWRIGYLAAPAELVGPLSKVPEVEVSCPTAPAQWAAVAALSGPQDCVREMRDAYRTRRDLAVAALRAGGPVRGRAPRRVLHLRRRLRRHVGHAAVREAPRPRPRRRVRAGRHVRPRRRGAGADLAGGGTRGRSTEGIRRIGEAVRAAA